MRSSIGKVISTYGDAWSQETTKPGSIIFPQAIIARVSTPPQQSLRTPAPTLTLEIEACYTHHIELSMEITCRWQGVFPCASVSSPNSIQRASHNAGYNSSSQPFSLASDPMPGSLFD